jgi:hypothetical protein
MKKHILIMMIIVVSLCIAITTSCAEEYKYAYVGGAPDYDVRVQTSPIVTNFPNAYCTNLIFTPLTQKAKKAVRNQFGSYTTSYAETVLLLKNSKQYILASVSTIDSRTRTKRTTEYYDSTPHIINAGSVLDTAWDTIIQMYGN